MMKYLTFLIAMLSFGLLFLQAQTVKIVRDKHWIPYIIGDTPRECAYGMARAI